MFQEDTAIFEVLRQQYELANKGKTGTLSNIAKSHIPDGFPSEYGTWHPDKKQKYASKEASTKVKRLAYLLYPKATQQERGERIKEIHTKAKRRNGVSLSGHIGYKGWEKIYLWLLDRIAHAHQIKGTENL